MYSEQIRLLLSDFQKLFMCQNKNISLGNFQKCHQIKNQKSPGRSLKSINPIIAQQRKMLTKNKKNHILVIIIIIPRHLAPLWMLWN